MTVDICASAKRRTFACAKSMSSRSRFGTVAHAALDRRTIEPDVALVPVETPRVLERDGVPAGLDRVEDALHGVAHVARGPGRGGGRRA